MLSDTENPPKNLLKGNYPFTTAAPWFIFSRHVPRCSVKLGFATGLFFVDVAAYIVLLGDQMSSLRQCHRGSCWSEREFGQIASCKLVCVMIQGSRQDGQQ